VCSSPVEAPRITAPPFWPTTRRMFVASRLARSTRAPPICCSLLAGRKAQLAAGSTYPQARRRSTPFLSDPRSAAFASSCASSIYRAAGRPYPGSADGRRPGSRQAQAAILDGCRLDSTATALHLLPPSIKRRRRRWRQGLLALSAVAVLLLMSRSACRDASSEPDHPPMPLCQSPGAALDLAARKPPLARPA
jgi:hypothetical protein